MNRLGYTILPIKSRGKAPAATGWNKPGYTPPLTGFEDNGIGIRCCCGDYPIIAIDIDVTDSGIAKKMRGYVDGLTGGVRAPYRVGNAPKFIIVCRTAKPTLKKHSQKYGCGLIEILAQGQQFVAAGIHPVTEKEYEWPEGSVFERPASSLPLLTDAQTDMILREFERIAEADGLKPAKAAAGHAEDLAPYDPEDPLDASRPLEDYPLEDAVIDLYKISPNCGRDEWVRTGMALHHQYGGSAEGLRIWKEWSRHGAEKFVEGDPEKQWASFREKEGVRPVTAATLKMMAADAETPEVSDEELDKIANAPRAAIENRIDNENGGGEPDDGNVFRKLNWSVGRFKREPDPLDTVIDGLMPLGSVGMLYSMGGAGKSTLALFLALRVALANVYDCDFLGRFVNPGRVALLSAEDPDSIINRRYSAILKQTAADLEIDYGDAHAAAEKYLSLASTNDSDVGPFFKVDFRGTVKPTASYAQLLAYLKGIPDLRLIIIDTKIQYSPVDEIDNVAATREIRYYERIAKTTGATVLLLHHTNKASRNGEGAGAQAYRGGSAAFDACRFAFYLRACAPKELEAQGIDTDDPNGYLILENTKNNYLPISPTLLLERRGCGFTARTLRSKAEKADAAMAEACAALEAMRGIGRPALRREIEEAVRAERGRGWNGAAGALRLLEAEGLAEKARDGQRYRYAVTAKGRNFNIQTDLRDE